MGKRTQKGRKQATKSKAVPKTVSASPLIPNVAMSLGNFGDNEPTRNVAELRFQIWDWFRYDSRFNVVTPSVQSGIFSYGLDEEQNFFGAVNETDPFPFRKANTTKNRVARVVVEVLSPVEAITYIERDAQGTEVSRVSSLPMVVCAVPIPQTTPGDDELALIGQQTTVVHPDVRQAWIKVGDWNWKTMFDDTQLQPHYATYPLEAPLPDGKALELFRLSVCDATTGNLLAKQKEGESFFLDFRIRIDMEAPIGLIPTPIRYSGKFAAFAGATNPPVDYASKDTTPVQYRVTGMQNKF